MRSKIKEPAGAQANKNDECKEGFAILGVATALLAGFALFFASIGFIADQSSDRNRIKDLEESVDYLRRDAAEKFVRQQMRDIEVDYLISSCVRKK